MEKCYEPDFTTVNSSCVRQFSDELFNLTLPRVLKKKTTFLCVKRSSNFFRPISHFDQHPKKATTFTSVRLDTSWTTERKKIPEFSTINLSDAFFGYLCLSLFKWTDFFLASQVSHSFSRIWILTFKSTDSFPRMLGIFLYWIMHLLGLSLLRMLKVC